VDARIPVPEIQPRQCGKAGIAKLRHNSSAGKGSVSEAGYGIRLLAGNPTTSNGMSISYRMPHSTGSIRGFDKFRRAFGNRSNRVRDGPIAGLHDPASLSVGG
jgi:hypothetical protein